MNNNNNIHLVVVKMIGYYDQMNNIFRLYF